MTTTAALAIATARMAPLGWVAPPLGGPARIARVIVALLLIAIVLPAVQASPQPGSLPSTLLTEALVGLFLGLLAALPLRAAESAGGLVDGAMHPWRRRGPLADAQALFALALFAAFDGPRLLIVAAAQSYAALPIGHGLASLEHGATSLGHGAAPLSHGAASLGHGAAPLSHGAALGGAALAHLDGAALEHILAIGTRLVAAAVTVAAPALAALLVTDVALALVARAQPLPSRAPFDSEGAAPLRFAVAVLAVAAGTLAAAHGLSRALADAAHLNLQP